MKDKTKDILGAITFWSILIIAWTVYVIGIRDIVVLKRNYISSCKVIDRETVSTFERKPIGKVYTRTDHRYFYPGDTLTSKENGALILWDSTMPESYIVGIVSDSGTIEHYKPE